VDVRSLGFRTDLMLRRLAGADVTDRGDHCVVRTPANPHFYWGNFLLVPPFGPGDAERRLAQFAVEFPDARHVALGVDGTDGADGETAALRDAGLAREVNVVLTAEHLAPAPGRAPVGVDLRPLDGDGDWEASVAFRIRCDADDSPENTAFVQGRQAELRSLVEAGHGVQVAAFADGAVRAELGLYADAAGLARYQAVETEAPYRRRGIASVLMVLADRELRGRRPLRGLVIVADPDDVAIGLYRRLGFVDAERQVQWQRAPG
jgi:ribosomal protein S18 acetylase RimI-like enzyme